LIPAEQPTLEWEGASSGRTTGNRRELKNNIRPALTYSPVRVSGGRAGAAPRVRPATLPDVILEAQTYFTATSTTFTITNKKATER
jgi:hypothetical protein